MGISGIIGKEIEKEFFRIWRAANGFPLHRRSRASPHLDPMPVLSQHRGASETANCARPLRFSKLHQQKLNWELMKPLDLSKFSCGARRTCRALLASGGTPAPGASSHPHAPGAQPCPAPAAPRDLPGSGLERCQGAACSRMGASGWPQPPGGAGVTPKLRQGATPAPRKAQAGRDRRAAAADAGAKPCLCQR